jgi:hypothetical protein
VKRRKSKKEGRKKESTRLSRKKGQTLVIVEMAILVK